MKPLPLLLGLAVWSASLAGAYYLGNLPARQAAGSDSSKAGPAKTAGGARPGATHYTPRAGLDASADPAGEAGDLTAASGKRSESAIRAELAEAFALPANDYRRSRVIREALSELAEIAPLEALSLADQIGSLRESEQARRAILETWGRNDPEAALMWAQEALANQPLGSRYEQMMAIYRGYGQNNPQAAFNSALALSAEGRTDQRIRSRALQEIIEVQIENGGLNAARQQIEQLEDEALRARLTREMIDEWAGFDPLAAAAYVEGMGDAADARVRASLLGEWAENDPAAAAAWLSQQNFDEETIGRASAEIIREWTRYDMAASAEWLNSLPSSPELDRAVMSYTFRAAQEDPANAMSWAESINNDNMRTRMMERVAGSWKAEDPEGFQKYLQTSNFTEEQRQMLENAREGGGMGGGRRWR